MDASDGTFAQLRPRIWCNGNGLPNVNNNLNLIISIVLKEEIYSNTSCTISSILFLSISFPVLPKAQARIFHHISFLQQARDRQKRKTSLIRPIPLQFHFDIQFLTMIRNVGLPLLRCLVDIKLPLFGQPPLPIFIFFAVFISFLILYHNKLDIFLIFLTWRSQTRRDIRKEWWKGLRPLPPSRRIHRHHLVHRNRIRRVNWVGWRWLRFGFSVNWTDTNYR